MTAPSRPSLRDIFLSAEKRVEVFFYTSNDQKFSQAATIFHRAGLGLRQFRSKGDPYREDYSVGKDQLLKNAIKEILGQVGRESLFFVEDTSLRIEALSDGVGDFPGLSVKEWFAATEFEALDAELKRRGNDRRAEVKSDIALHVPGLPRPVFFRSSTKGLVADTKPAFAANVQHPWLTPDTFNGWFVPSGATKRLGEMSFEESWQYDFRGKAMAMLVDRLEEYVALLNLSPRSYSRRIPAPSRNDNWLFPVASPIFVVVGKTCAGKSTFGNRALEKGLEWIEASSVLRTFASGYDEETVDPFEFAKKLLNEKGADVVALKILRMVENALPRGIAITGFRTIEELETIKSRYPVAKVVLIEANERDRYVRDLARGRAQQVSRADFRGNDKKQWSFGLLRVAEEFADVRVVNEGTLDEFLQQADHVIEDRLRPQVRGVSMAIRPRHGLRESQVYRCLHALSEAGRALSCQEIQVLTGKTGAEIRFNNVNKVLKKVPELAKRFDVERELVRYEITNTGRAYIRYMRLKFEEKK